VKKLNFIGGLTRDPNDFEIELLQYKKTATPNQTTEKEK
jgi:hypothetical protein